MASIHRREGKTGEVGMTLWQQLREVIRTTPRAITDAMWRWSYRQHAPYDLNGDQSRAVCVQCKEDWPCRGTLRLDAEREKAGHDWVTPESLQRVARASLKAHEKITPESIHKAGRRQR